MHPVLFAALLLAADAPPAVQTNVVYGMYSGAALLMDVHRPASPNGYGIVFISGSGWTTPMDYSSWQLKSNGQSKMYAKPLVAAGFTVFTLNHRSLPRFTHPAALEDVQRAVRYVRHHAKEFGIRADRIGASGGSSGGHLVSLLGTMDGQGDPNHADPVERESAKVQCVVARAAPTNLFTMPLGGQKLLGMQLVDGTNALPKSSREYKAYVAASPVSYISADDPPFYVIHGDKDATVPYSQSVEFEKALRAAGVTTKLVVVEGADHGPSFPGAKNPGGYMDDMVAWFRRHLMAQ